MAVASPRARPSKAATFGSSSSGLARPARLAGSVVATHIEVASCIGLKGRTAATAKSAGRGGSRRAVPAARAGVGLAQDQAADQAAEVVAVLDQVAGQPAQQLGMARPVLRVHLVQGHHQPDGRSSGARGG